MKKHVHLLKLINTPQIVQLTNIYIKNELLLCFQ